MNISEKTKKLLHDQRLGKAIRTLKPWVSAVVFLLILRYTGALAGISTLANSALMKTGMLDADPAMLAPGKDFNYDFTLRDLKGNIVDVNQFKGKTIFINLWATWCGPCRVEMPSIQSLYTKVDHDKTVFVMLSLDREQDRAKVVQFVKDKGYTFPVYVPGDYLPEQLQVSSIPTTFIISPEGKIVSRKTGTANYDTAEFKEYLDGLSEKK